MRGTHIPDSKALAILIVMRNSQRYLRKLMTAGRTDIHHFIGIHYITFHVTKNCSFIYFKQLNDHVK